MRLRRERTATVPLTILFQGPGGARGPELRLSRRGLYAGQQGLDLPPRAERSGPGERRGGPLRGVRGVSGQPSLKFLNSAESMPVGVLSID